jgi:hypothetical protein
LLFFASLLENGVEQKEIVGKMDQCHGKDAFVAFPCKAEQKGGKKGHRRPEERLREHVHDAKAARYENVRQTDRSKLHASRDDAQQGLQQKKSEKEFLDEGLDEQLVPGKVNVGTSHEPSRQACAEQHVEKRVEERFAREDKLILCPLDKAAAETDNLHEPCLPNRLQLGN